MDWKRIGCAVDFSPESRVALERAAALATRCGASLTLVHVDDRTEGPAGDATLAGSVSLARGRIELERMLGEWSEGARRLTSRPVDFLLLTGDPAPELVRLAERQPFDLVVVGTHGRPDEERLRFGSVAQAIVRDAGCSVLVVRRS